MCSHGRAHWRNLVNMILRSICGGNVALCQVSLTTCHYLGIIRAGILLAGWPSCHRADSVKELNGTDHSPTCLINHPHAASFFDPTVPFTPDLYQYRTKLLSTLGICRCDMLCEGSTRTEEELAANIRGLESRIREQVGQCVSLSGTLCARVVPRHRAGTSNIHSTGAQRLSTVHTACEVVDWN